MSRIIGGTRTKRRKPENVALVLMPERSKRRAPRLLNLPADLLQRCVTEPLMNECTTQRLLKARQRLLMRLRATNSLLKTLTSAVKVCSWTCAGARNMELALSLAVSCFSRTLKCLHLPKMAITNDTLVLLADLSEQLHKIDLNGCIGLTDGMLAMIVRKCPQLKYLGVRRCYALTDRAFIAVAENCPKLMTFDAGYTNIGDSALDQVSLQCPKLQVVNLSHCHAVTDSAVSQLLTRCPVLHSLDLDRCVSLTDAALRHVGPMLQHLNLRLCVLITDKTLDFLAAVRLITLNINSTLVTDCGLSHLQCQKCLTQLDVIGTRVTYLGLEHLHALLPLAAVRSQGNPI